MANNIKSTRAYLNDIEIEYLLSLLEHQQGSLAGKLKAKLLKSSITFAKIEQKTPGFSSLIEESKKFETQQNRDEVRSQLLINDSLNGLTISDDDRLWFFQVNGYQL